MKESSSALRWRILNEGEWSALRDIRLAALRDSPSSFLSSYNKEVAYEETQWRTEFSRGQWIIIVGKDEQPFGLIGITQGIDIPSTDRYLEYLWISPEWRRSGAASSLIQIVLEQLSAVGIVAVWLWILDGNKPARQLYEKFGFVSTNERQVLRDDPRRFEERMRLILEVNLS